MEEIKLQLSGFWVALMLTYLLGDVLRIFSGDFKPGEIGGKKMGQEMYLGIAVFMTIPIVMLVLCLTLPGSVSRWVNMSAAVVLFIFNLIGLPSYPSAFDKYLIVVGLVFNALTVWFAWNWAV
jgi:hypothetical protein